jgi:LysR family transcriptional regulator, regulator of abg operon
VSRQFDALRAFVAVCEAGSFASAAAASGESRMRLTRRVDALERDLGVQLLNRSETGVDLTPAGRLLLREGPSVVAEFDALLST